MIHRCTTKLKKYYGQKCMQDIEKLIKHHDFPEEGTLSLTRLKVVRNKVATNNQVVVANVLKMYVKNSSCTGCARTMDTGHRIVQRRVRRIETRGTENRRGEGG